MNIFTKYRKSIKLNAILNVIRQCSSILVSLVLYPYAIRILGEENFGKVSYAISAIDYFTVIAAFGVPVYIVREGAKVRKNKDKIRELASELFTINIFSMLFSLFLVISFICVSNIFLPQVRDKNILIAILSFNIVFSILSRDWVNVIYEDYLFPTIRYLIFELIFAILLITFVKRTEHFVIYTIIMVISRSGGYIADLFYTQRYIPLSISFKPRLKKHVKPLLYFLCASLTLGIYIQSDIILLGWIRTDAEVGAYAFVSRIYFAVKSILNAITLVAIPRISHCIGNGNITEYNKILGKLKDSLITLIFPCAVGLLALGKNIIFLLGKKEAMSGDKAFAIQCIALLFAVLACYYAQGILIPNKKENQYFLCTLISSILNMILNVFAINWIGMEGAALTTLVAEMVVLLTCRHFSKGLHKEERNNSLLPILIGCLLIFCSCKIICLLGLTVLVETILSIAVSVVLYFVVLYFGKNTLAKEGLGLALKMWHSIVRSS